MEIRKTHFEQIPVATVKQIAQELPVSEIGDRMPEADASVPGDWREVARRVQVETDADKMLELVQDLIQKYDAEKPARRGSIRQTGLSPATTLSQTGEKP